MTGTVVILGVFVADTAFRAARAPRMGETIIGSGFALGPGGKGSNQAVAAARLGADVTLLSKLGRDPFADMAHQIWADAGVRPMVEQSADGYTGAASIFVDDATGENAIIVCPGAGATIAVGDIEAWSAPIEAAAVFMTQLEQPLAAAVRALEIARAGGVRTILDPAPATKLPDGMLALCDYVTPNETEAEMLTGVAVKSPDDAARAAEAFLARGVGCAVITLGARGALIRSAAGAELVAAVDAGPVIETTGAGDAFNGAFATALARGDDAIDAVRFGCAAAGISVTRPGTALSMASLADVEAVMAGITNPR